MKCEEKGCNDEVLEFSGAAARPLCPRHRHGAKAAAAPEEKLLANKDELTTLGQLSGVGQEVADALAAGGFRTAASVRAVTDEVLLAVPGIGDKRLALIREALG